MISSKTVTAWLRSLLAAVSLLIAAQGALAQETEHPVVQELRKLSWVHGPSVVRIESVAQFNLPKGFVFLGKHDTSRFMELMENPPSDREYLFAPEDLSWFATFQYDPVGYVKDDEQVDAGAILSSIRDSTEESNKARRARGWSTLTITGWKYPPNYDTQTKRLEWAIDGVDSNQESVVNFNTRLLGRSGVTSAMLVASPQGLDASVARFKAALENFSYNSGERYSEFKQGDRMAEYGLTALIVGGTAAAAAKSGLLKGLWKIILAGIFAVVAGVKALFSRKKSD